MSIDNLCIIGYGLALAATYYSYKKKPIATSLSEDTMVINLAREFGWGVLIHPTAEDHVRFLSNHQEGKYSHIEVRTTVCAILLGALRDDHPDAEVADKAVELFQLLNRSTYTTEKYNTTI